MRFDGVPIVPGIAHGPLWAPPLQPISTFDKTLGLEAFHSARDRFVRAAATLPQEFATMYRALAEDPMWDDGVAAQLQRGANLPEAVAATARAAVQTIAGVSDDYLRERSADVTQVAAQFVRLLGDPVEPPAGAIAVLADATGVELHGWAGRLSGVVLLNISTTSHLAIVARGLGIPALALAGIDGTRIASAAEAKGNGSASSVAILNGFEGWIENPTDAAQRACYSAERVTARPDFEAVIVRGRRISVYANLNLPQEARSAVELGADGVGLVRTEFLYAGASKAPTLEVERAAYQTIAQAFSGKPIIVRTLDLGGDKTGPGAPPQESDLDRGMLGMRGIRLSLQQPQLFEQHLRAIVSGFAGADVRIMFPMIALPEEFARARDAVQAAVKAENLQRVPPLGLMIEVPAAAYALDAFAREGASFASLGTNDMEQYFFAANRLDARATPQRDRDRTAWRRFLTDVITKAHEAGLEVGVCGEAAGDPSLTDLWLATRVEELSITPGLVPWLKAHLRSQSA